MRLVAEDLVARHPASSSGAAPALRGVTLRVEAGEQVAIIGPSGAGKTTLLQVFACALEPTAGRLRLDDLDPWTLPRGKLQKLRGRLFLAAQVPPLPPRQRVVTAVLAGRLPSWSLWQSLRSLVYPLVIDEAARALARFDLAEKLFERVDRLSGGERQRVGLSRSLLSPASLLLVDEPLSALDPTRAAQAIAALTSAAGDRHATLVATLHQVEFALSHFPRVIGLRDGGVAFDAPSAKVTKAQLSALYAQHEHELRAPPPMPDELPTGAPVAVHCR